MDLDLSAEQEQLVDAFSSLYSKESSSERIRAAEPSGFDPELWQTLLAAGALEMAVGDPTSDAGSAGQPPATLLDVALVAELHGRHLGSVPLLEAQVAARLLEALGSEPASTLLGQALAGEKLVSLALRSPNRGRLSLVPAGAVADVVLFADGDRVLSVAPGAGRTPVVNRGDLPLADLDVTAPEVLAEGPAAQEAFERVLDEWLSLTASACTGMAARALEIGVGYAKERHAFGVPIGSFQAVAHGLADAATVVDGSQLLSREAAWSAAEEPERFRELAALAFGFASEAVRQASDRSLHYHGGYGFMLEYDIQLYWRRATAWPGVFGEPDAAYARAAAERLRRPEPQRRSSHAAQQAQAERLARAALSADARGSGRKG